MRLVVLLSVGVTAMEAIQGRSARVAVVITNMGSADEIVRIDVNNLTVATSAIVLFNRDTIKLKGYMAKQRIWVISDTATTAVNVTPVY